MGVLTPPPLNNHPALVALTLGKAFQGKKTGAEIDGALGVPESTEKRKAQATAGSSRKHRGLTPPLQFATLPPAQTRGKGFHKTDAAQEAGALGVPVNARNGSTFHIAYFLFGAHPSVLCFFSLLRPGRRARLFKMAIAFSGDISLGGAGEPADGDSELKAALTASREEEAKRIAAEAKAAAVEVDLIRQSAAEEDERVAELKIIDVALGEFVKVYFGRSGRSIVNSFNPDADGDCLLACVLTRDHPDKAISPDALFDLRSQVVEEVRRVKLIALQKRVQKLRQDRDRHQQQGNKIAVFAVNGSIKNIETIQTDAVHEYCNAMAKKGVVMGEDELEAIATVRNGPLLVWPVVCIEKSHDFLCPITEKLFEPRVPSSAVGAMARPLCEIMQVVVASGAPHFVLLQTKPGNSGPLSLSLSLLPACT